MPGVWLGEEGIPETREMAPGVVEFGLYRDAPLRPRIVVYVLILGFASLVCVPGIVLSFGDWYPFSLFSGFYGLVAGLFFYAIFKSSTYSIDTQTRRISRSFFLLDRKLRTRTWELIDGDEFTIYLSPDSHNSGGEHCIYLTRQGLDQLFCCLHLPTAEPSEELKDWLGNFATALRIGNAGYRQQSTYLKRLLTFRFPKSRTRSKGQ